MAPSFCDRPKFASVQPPADVVGINISDQQLEVCRADVLGCNFVLIDAAHMVFEDSSFDNIIHVEAACNFSTREKFVQGAWCIKIK